MHPDVILTDFKEPHKRFVERMDRDYTIHEVIPPYELGEIRLRSDHIAQRGGLASSADQLLRAAREDLPALVTLEDDAVNRIHAFYIAMEYQGHVKYAHFEGSPDNDNVYGGPLTFLKELETRRREVPGLSFIVLVDRRFRKKVHELLVESKVVYPSYAAAMYEVFHNHRYIWSDCRSETRDQVRVDARDKEQSAKRGAPIDTSSAVLTQESKSAKRRRLRQAQSDKKQSAPAERPPAKGNGKNPKGSASVSGPRVPDAEWKALHQLRSAHTPNTCKYWNMSTGCLSKPCKFKHICWLCGSEDHKWCSRHFYG